MVEIDQAKPLYRQVADDIRGRIECGELSAGKSIESEAELCKIYQVSRATVRNAIASLVKEGLLVTYKGRGTFVKASKITSNLNTFKGFTYFCRENHIDQYTHILESKQCLPSGQVAKKLSISTDTPVIYMKRLRYIKKTPVVVEEMYIPYDGYGFLLETDMENKSLYGEIERHTGVRLENNCYPSVVLETALASEEELHLLQLKAPQPVFVLTETVYTNDSRPVHWAKQILSGTYFKFYMSNKVNQLTMNWEKV